MTPSHFKNIKDEDLKKNMESVCKDMGLSMTTAFTIFATRVTKEKRIPFERYTLRAYCRACKAQYSR